jgi:hypothetical protein
MSKDQDPSFPPRPPNMCSGTTFLALPTDHYGQNGRSHSGTVLLPSALCCSVAVWGVYAGRLISFGRPRGCSLCLLVKILLFRTSPALFCKVVRVGPSQ